MARKSPTAPEAPTAPVTPAVEPASPEASGIEVVADRSSVLILSEHAGRTTYIYGFVPGRGVLAADTRRGAPPINKTQAQEILKDVRKDFPHARIEFVE